jgi:glycerophosphoryl diester phosphodiesterase
MSTPSFLVPGSRPLVLGHRGDSACHPENTLLAFGQALRAGADGVELDVMRCASGEVVVVHDDDLARVANKASGSERWVRHSTLAELRRFDVGRGERVPTLAEVCEELGPHALINVELKSPESSNVRQYLQLLHDDGLAEAVAVVLRQAGRLPTARLGDRAETTLISSFDPLQLRRFFAHTDVLPLGYLFHHGQGALMRNLWQLPGLTVRAVHPQAALIDAVVLRRWRQAGLGVHTWTVDDPREVAALRTLGVDAIITNKPGAVRAQLDALGTAGATAPP